MAIVRNMWMRNTRQQVAGAVLYNLKGQTIQREKAASVANPRTTAQMDQRVKLANLVNFYRANKAWMAKGAFESKKQTWSDYNAFVSANLASNPICLTKQQANEGQCILYPYQVTKGSLPALAYFGGEDVIDFEYRATTAPTTWGALSEILIANYPGLQNGDQFSMIQYKQSNGSAAPYFLSIVAFEKNLDTSSTEVLSNLFPNAQFKASGITFGDDFFDGLVYGASFCMSRSVGGSIKVSDSYVVLRKRDIVETVLTDAAIAEAIASYGGSSVNFLDNGTEGLSAPASGGNSGGSGSGDPGDVTP